jgi:UDP-glucose 4-epimerase
VVLKRVLVTGGAGFIGHHLIKALARTHEVVVVDNLSNTNQNSASVGPGVAFYKEDIRNAETMSDIVKRERVDACVHLAAKVSVADSVRNPAETTSVNVMGTFSVLEACAANHVSKFILASSAAVYGTPREGPSVRGSRLGAAFAIRGKQGRGGSAGGLVSELGQDKERHFAPLL